MRTPSSSGPNESSNSDVDWAVDAAEFVGGDGYGIIARGVASGMQLLVDGGARQIDTPAYLEGDDIFGIVTAAKPVIGIDGFGINREAVKGEVQLPEGDANNIFGLDTKVAKPVIGSD